MTKMPYCIISPKKKYTFITLYEQIDYWFWIILSWFPGQRSRYWQLAIHSHEARLSSRVKFVVTHIQTLNIAIGNQSRITNKRSEAFWVPKYQYERQQRDPEWLLLCDLIQSNHIFMFHYRFVSGCWFQTRNQTNQK